MCKCEWLAVAVSMSTLFGAVCAATQEKVIIPDLAKVADGEMWKVYNATPETVEVDGKRTLRLTAKGDSSQRIAGLALVAGSKLTTGTIEVDLDGKNLRQQSFLGVAFNVADATHFESVYFRPFNFRSDPPFKTRAVQYIAWPENTWDKLRETQPGKFEDAINPVPDPDGWFHARIAVGPKQVKVHVNDAPDPCLTVDRLATGGLGRPVGLFVDVAEGLYANVKITPTP